MYHSEDFSYVNIKGFITQLIADINQIYHISENKISYQLNIEKIQFISENVHFGRKKEDKALKIIENFSKI